MSQLPSTQLTHYHRRTKEQGIRNKLTAQSDLHDVCTASYNPTAEQLQRTKRNEVRLLKKGEKLYIDEQMEKELKALRSMQTTYTPRCKLLSHERYTLLESIYRFVISPAFTKYNTEHR
jgi:hypothetical protein